MNKKPKTINGLLVIAALGLIILFLVAMGGNRKQQTMKYSEFVSYFERAEVSEMTLDLNNGSAQIKVDGKDEPVLYTVPYLQLFMSNLDGYVALRAEANPDSPMIYDFDPLTETPIWMTMLPMFLVSLLLMGGLYYFMYLQSGGGKPMNVGRARVKDQADTGRKATFKDVAGADEEKAELEEIVEFLKNQQKFNSLGARIPHGVLFVGPPGTGKTLLARACAGEAGVPFYSISGSDFVEMYVGVGASRVRDLFDTAKKNPASIIFIDEIDAVGRHRGAGLGGGHDEREQTLNQLLVEMDGFGGNEGVIVIAATNRPDILDPALLRPGRFDRQITVNYPDINGREEILKVHANGKSFEENVDLHTLAKTTVGFTGADLANLLNEAALLAARKGKSLIGMNDLEDATIKVLVGPQKKSKIISEKEKRLTAYHEAGHAIVTKILQPDTPVHQISIIPSGRAGGYTLSLPKEDRSYDSKSEMENEIVSLLGGRVAEKLILGDISTGASNDIQRATTIARNMVTRYGMSDVLGPIVYGSEHNSDEVFLGRDFNTSRNYSEDTATLIDNEIKRLVETAYNTAMKLLNENIDKLHFIAAFLMKHEVMDEAQFNAAMDDGATEEELEALAEEKRRRSEEENRNRAIADEEARQRREAEEKAKAQNHHPGHDGDFPPRMKE